MVLLKDQDIGESSSELVFYVNGKKVVEPNPDPEWTLLWYLRKKLRLIGTKLGCAEGGCGACTVMVSKYNRSEKKVVHLAVNACLAPVCAMHGLAVTTVEGIGSTKTKLHPVQERIAKAHGSQCGFCTPGIVMSMYTLLRSCKHIKYSDVEVAFQGNLCRCTGYRAIIEGYKTFIEDWETKRVLNGTHNGIGTQNGVCAMGKDCCKNKTDKGEDKSETEYIFDKSSFLPYDSSQEPIFPPELKLSSVYDDQCLVYRGKNTTWYRPTELDSILKLKEQYPDAKIVVGNTEVGVEVKFKHCVYPVIIMPNCVPEMTAVVETEEGLTVGAAVTLMDLEHTCNKYINSCPPHKTRVLKTVVEMLNWFAGKQIRNVAAIGGNIMTGSPISDLNPILMSQKVKLNLMSKDGGQRSVLMDETFFTGYRRNVVKPNEILLSIEIPFSHKYQYVKAFKQAKRREDDISIVTAAINVEFEDNTNVIKYINLAFGGMAPVTKIATKTGEALKGLKWNEEMLELAYSKMLEELPLIPSAPGGNIQYRRALTMSLFLKAYLSIAKEMSRDYIQEDFVKSYHSSGAEQFHGALPKSSQYFELIGDKQLPSDAVGRPVQHRSAFKQATGEAIYCDDMPAAEGELYLAFVLSTKAHAKLLSVDPKEALEMPGVVAFYSAKDLTPEQNMIGPIFHDEELFAREKVISQGQTIGVIIGEDQAIAQAAARKVKVEYEELQPIIVTIEDAIKHKSFYPQFPKTIKKGDIKPVFEDKNNIIIEGQCRMGGQEHFYLETHAAFAIPKEDDELEIFCSSQHPSEIAKLTSHILHVPMNRIACRVKRMGGGFGGKESRGLLTSLPVALAAHKLNRPVRCMLDRDEDMQMTGTRHPFLIKYKLAATKEGKVLGAEVNIYNNGGYSIDLSGPVVERAMYHYENAYYIPNVEVTGHICKTNLPSNTAFRGFGGPQGMFGAENMIRDLASKLGKSPEEISRINLYKENCVTHYGQTLTHCTLQRCWDECVQKSNLAQRKIDIENFNQQHRWRKRGISIIPTKFGIAFTEKLLNQAGALVIIYVDGSVLLSHGGTEMGQGLHTKMIQVASRVLGIDISKIHITDTATDKVPNTSATAASAGSDLNGMAVLEACQTLMKRLQPFKDKNPNGTWENWVSAAFVDRVSLSSTGFHATPDIGYDFKANKGKPFNYFTYGVACTEVEIDCLSGDHQVIRTDIVMDLGESLNPAIDIGQIEGAFIQGYGLFTMEELIYSPTGTLYSRGPGAYKIPGFGDIPQEFNVSLLKGAPNPRAVYSSKAVGEPPLFLASSAFFAIKEAIKAARLDAGASPDFRLDSPATSARIRMACEDHITKKLDNPDPNSFVPWNVVP